MTALPDRDAELDMRARLSSTGLAGDATLDATLVDSILGPSGAKSLFRLTFPEGDL